MNTLSTILADIEASVAKVRTLETELATEKQRGRELAEKYRTESGEVLKTLGLDESKRERKSRPQESIILSAANRKIKQMVAAGEKNQKTLQTAALEAAAKIAKSRFGLAELSAELKAQIEEKLKTVAKK